MALIHRLNEDGKTFIIVEHDMNVIMNHCQNAIASITAKRLLKEAAV